MQIIVNINTNINRRQLSMIDGDSMAAKLDSIVHHLTDEFGVYASAGQTASSVWVELEEGSPVDFVRGLEFFKFF
jgi:hypothetical protein